MKNVLLCGLGAVGMTYAVKLKEHCNLKILLDKNRFDRYLHSKPVFNGKEQEFEYILPNQEFQADLVIIATKSNGLSEAVKNLKNFVHKGTIIISLMNGISSEEIIQSSYPEATILRSYFIGHSAVREGNSVTQDGVGEIVIEKNQKIARFFEQAGINYSMPEDILYSMWLKYTFNIFSNQTSAILNMNFGELKRNREFKNFAKNIVNEVREIAQRKGVNNLDRLEDDALKSLERMCDDGKTSMHQDILAGRKTEIDIFAGEIIRLGKEFGIPTPYNQVLFDLIKIMEEK